MAKTRKSPGGLDVIEFDGSESVAKYALASRDHNRALCQEYEAAADDLYGILRQFGEGHWWAFGHDVKRRAERVVKRLERMSEMAGWVATESVLLNLEYRRQFSELVEPEKDKPKREWAW
ncbi:hypothetical protein ACIBKY_51975 [Nonomuraea sp. NPDC050394]|uniref:hypothetical protein n=1 Tax=Nonomuraea sp. NPDC050394 TaxID=3364363 RepID=UPI0037A4DCA5